MRFLLLFAAVLGLVRAAPTPLHTPPASVLASDAVSVAPAIYYAVLADQDDRKPAADRARAFYDQLRQAGIEVRPRYALDVLGAVSFELSNPEAEDALRGLAAQPDGLAGITDLFPMLSMAPPRVIKADVKNPQLKFSHGITGVAIVHEKYRYTGKGVKVGVIDSGIDYMHPALGGCFGKGCRVTVGYDFVGDDYDGRTKPAIPDDDPRDVCNGHGVHVAGIIGARDKDFIGVAPDVTFGAYRVFGCKGSTANDIILAAMERAFKDGMDVINLSLGGGSSWAQYPDSILADKLTDRGMVVLAAMGNDGDKGAWMASSPGMTSKGFGVASFDNYRYYAYGFTIDGAQPKVSMDYASSKEGLVLNFTSTELARFVPPAATAAAPTAANADTSAEQPTDLGCDPIPGLDLTGKIALVRRGVCTFAQKALNVQQSGAIAMLVYNKEFGAFTPGVDDKAVTIPVVGITQDNGNKLVELLVKGQTVKLTFDQNKQVYDNPTGGKPSGFSSWGPGPELELKPDIGAPGGLIYSTYPLDMGKYATLSGTSMATPYTAGAVALYIQHARGKGLSPRRVNPLEIRDVLKMTANPTTQLDKPDITIPVQKQGAGLINLLAALRTVTHVTPTMIPLNATDINGGRNGIERSITVKNTGSTLMTYEVRHRPAAAIAPMDKASGELLGVPKQQAGYAKLTFSPAGKFTLRAGESRRINLSFAPPADLPADEIWLYGGYIVVEPTSFSGDANAQPVITIPYAGMKGAYKTLGPLSKPESGFPALINGSSNKALPTPTKPDDTVGTFTLKKNDVPYVAIRLARPCKKLFVKLLDAANGDAELGTIPGGFQEVVGRNDASEENLSIQIPWEGRYIPDKASNDRDTSFGSKKLGARMPADPAKNATTVIVPDNGKYKFRVMALYPFGDPKRVASFQTWTSPVIAVDRTKEPPVVDITDIGKVRGRRIRVRMNEWLRNALQLTVEDSDVDGAPASPEQEVRARQRESDMTVLPARTIVLPARTA